jgi:hypothetical protein
MNLHITCEKGATVNVHLTAIGSPTTDAAVAAATVLEPATGLEWSKTLLDGERVNFEKAENAVAELGEGWRLPTREELLTLVDLERHDPCIDTDKYPDTKSTWYWTATPCAWNRESAHWVVDFDSGYVYGNGLDYGACVRAVRGGQ